MTSPEVQVSFIYFVHSPINHYTYITVHWWRNKFYQYDYLSLSFSLSLCLSLSLSRLLSLSLSLSRSRSQQQGEELPGLGCCQVAVVAAFRFLWLLSLEMSVCVWLKGVWVWGVCMCVCECVCVCEGERDVTCSCEDIWQEDEGKKRGRSVEGWIWINTALQKNRCFLWAAEICEVDRKLHHSIFVSAQRGLKGGRKETVKETVQDRWREWVLAEPPVSLLYTYHSTLVRHVSHFMSALLILSVSSTQSLWCFFASGKNELELGLSVCLQVAMYLADNVNKICLNCTWSLHPMTVFQNCKIRSSNISPQHGRHLWSWLVNVPKLLVINLQSAYRRHLCVNHGPRQQSIHWSHTKCFNVCCLYVVFVANSRVFPLKPRNKHKLEFSCKPEVFR